MPGTTPLQLSLLGGRPRDSPFWGPTRPTPTHSVSTPRGTGCFCLGIFPKHRLDPGEEQRGYLRHGEAEAGVSLVFQKQTLMVKSSQENRWGLGVGVGDW